MEVVACLRDKNSFFIDFDTPEQKIIDWTSKMFSLISNKKFMIEVLVIISSKLKIQLFKYDEDDD